jgi:RND family efflux transporter MFP subunit
MTTQQDEKPSRPAKAPAGNTEAAQGGATGNEATGSGVTATSAATTWRKRLPAIAIVAAALAIGILPRIQARSEVRQQTQALAIPTVSVAYPQASPTVDHIDLPAAVQPYQDVPIFARTTGYVAHWYADIGTHVKEGQLLAVIDTPEVDAQLEQAKATAASAVADYEIAKTTADRWQILLKTNSVSRQTVEQDVGVMKAREATLAAARANVNRLAKMQSFEQVYAPFAGIVTARNVDVGTLIDPGSSGGPKTEMFHLEETDKLRVFASCPQDDVRNSGVGTPATLSLSQWPGRTFGGTVTRTAGAIDPVTRTLRTEVDVDNGDGAILPGAYAYIHLNAVNAQPHVTVPVSALLFRPDGVQVATVNAANRVSMQAVTLGRDFGTRVEVVSGLNGHERVIANPNDAVASGDAVHIAGKNDHA